MIDVIKRNGSEAIQKCVETLIDWAGIGDSGLDGYWFGYEALHDETNICSADLRAIMKHLKSLGIVTYETCYNGDGELHGKGYFIRDRTWKEIKDILND